jgi:hypothetical protein
MGAREVGDLLISPPPSSPLILLVIEFRPLTNSRLATVYHSVESRGRLLLFAGENKEPHETCEGGECGGMEEGRWTYKNKFQGRIIIENDRDHAEVSQHPCGST